MERLRRRFSEEELRAAQDDAAALRELIGASRGYALQKMKKAGMAPSLEALMEDPHPDSVMFILDNHELTREQQKKLAPFFSMSLASARLGSGAQTEAELDEALAHGGVVNPKALLSARQINQFADQIRRRYDEDEYGTLRWMKASLRALSLEEVEGLNPEILKAHLDIWAGKPGAFDRPGARSRYKELLLESVKGTRFKPRWSDFERWPFEPEDKPFLLGLLRDGDSYHGLGYADVQKNPSAAALVGPWEFVEKCNRWSVAHLSMEETARRKSQIQALWEENTLSSGHPQLTRAASKAAASLEQMELLVDEGMVWRLARGGAWMDPDRLGDSNEERQRELILWAAMAKAALADPENSGELMGARELGDAVKRLTEGNSAASPRPQDAALASRIAKEILPSRLKSGPGLAEALEHGRDAWKRPGVFEALAEGLLERPTPNGLFLALGVWRSEGTARSRRMGAVGKQSQLLARRLMREVDAGSASAMAAYFKAPFKPGVKARGASSFEDDFLKADYNRLDALDDGLLRLLSKVDAGFAAKAAQSETAPSERLLGFMLGSESIPGRVEALRSWAERFPKAFEEAPDFLAALSRHPDGPAIWPMDAEARESEALRAAEQSARERSELRRAKEIASAQIEREMGPSRNDEYWDDEDEGGPQEPESDRLRALRASKEELENKERERRQDIEAALSGVSFERMGKALDAALAADDYELFEGLSLGAGRAHKDEERFAARARSLTAERFMELLGSNERFAQLIKGAVKYNGENQLALDFGSAQANERVCEALLGVFPKDPVLAIAVFEQAAAQGFSNAFAARRLPERALFDYRLEPGREGRASSSKALVGRPYSDEEVLSMWDQVEAGAGFFSDMDTNARPGDFLSANFSGDLDRLRGFLKKAAGRPKLYALMCAGQMLRNVIEKQNQERPEGQEREGLDEGRCRLFAQEFDFGVVLRGVEEILDEMSRRRGQENFNAPLALSAAQSVVWSTYWDERNPATGKDIFKSFLSDEKSSRLLGLICQKAPAMAYSLYAVGGLGLACDAFEKRPGEFAGEEALDDFLFPSVEHAPGGLSFGHQRGELALGYLRGLARWLIDSERHEDAEYLNWALRHSEFKENELSHEHQSMARGRWMSDAPLDLIKESEDEELKKLLSVAFERLEIQETLGKTAAARRRSMRM